MNPTPSPLVLRRACVRRLSVVSAALSAFALGALSVSAAVTPVFSDNFDDGNRDGWYNFAGTTPSNLSAVLNVEGTSPHPHQGRALRAINSSAGGVVYFNAQSLAVGESLTVRFDFSTVSVSAADANLRFGISNSVGGVKVTEDANNPSQFLGYAGYRVATNTGSTNSGRTVISKSDPSVTDGITTGNNWSTVNSTGSTNGVGLTAATSYAVSITYERTGASSLEVRFSMNGVVASAEDTSAMNFTFDSFGYSKSSSNGHIYFDNFEVTYSSIPEPSSAVLLSGLAVGALVFVRRRARG